jgi:hypothetical protein
MVAPKTKLEPLLSRQGHRNPPSILAHHSLILREWKILLQRLVAIAIAGASLPPRRRTVNLHLHLLLLSDRMQVLEAATLPWAVPTDPARVSPMTPNKRSRLVPTFVQIPLNAPVKNHPNFSKTAVQNPKRGVYLENGKPRSHSRRRIERSESWKRNEQKVH